jgi:putative addiction module component (TIGR02574 family)
MQPGLTFCAAAKSTQICIHLRAAVELTARSTTMATVDDAFSYAQSLSPAEQHLLIERLLEAMPEQDFQPPASHLAEVERRCAEFDAGRMESFSWEEVRDEARRRISEQ